MELTITHPFFSRSLPERCLKNGRIHWTKIPAIRLSGSSEAKTSGPFFAAALSRSPPLLGTSDVMSLP